jgi:hypothetical protein
LLSVKKNIQDLEKTFRKPSSRMNNKDWIDKRSTTAGILSDLFQMTRCLRPGNYPSCDSKPLSLLFVPSSLHAIVEDLTLGATVSKGGLTFALVQVAVAVFRGGLIPRDAQSCRGLLDGASR